MSTNGEDVERSQDGEVEPMTRRSSGAGWWVAAAVAALAAVGLFFILQAQDRQEQLQAARQQGAVEARLDDATNNAQRAAVQANRAAQSATDASAQATRRAAETAQSAAAQAARSAGDAAQDASATEPAQGPSAQGQQ